MTTSAIGTISSLYPAQNTNKVSAAQTIESSLSSVSGHGHKHGGKFMQDVMQALQNMGINIASPTSSSSNSSQTASTTNSNNQNPQQALQTFMYDLRQALNQSGSQTLGVNANNSVSTTSQNGYSDFSQNLQNLISSVNAPSNTPTSNKNAVSTLQTDFNNLVNSFGGVTSSTTPTTSSATLQNFLQQLLSSMGNDNYSSNAIGSLLTTQA